MREADVKRKTAETDISLYINIGGTGVSEISSGVGFLDHMLTLFAKHSGFDLKLTCHGDTQIDDHHSVEDIGIVLGCAFKEALGQKIGIRRYGSALIPMDEALIQTAVDLSGRSFLSLNLNLLTEKIGTFDCELVEEFLQAFVRNADITLHINQISGKNSHHIVEGVFKSLARALREACEIDLRFSENIPSTKGAL